MKNHIKYYVLLVLCINVTTLFSSQAALFSYLGTRASGMGGAGTTLGETSEAIFYNWAAPSPFTKPLYKLDQGQALDFPIYSLSVQNPWHIQKLRLSYTYLEIGNFQRSVLNDRYQPVLTNESFSNSSHTFYTSYYWTVSSLNIGIRHHLYYETLDKETATSTGLDFAFYNNFETKYVPIKWGLALTNYLSSPLSWSTGHKDTLTKRITTGFGASISPCWQINADWTLENLKPTPLKLGTEYWLSGNWKSMPSYAIRAGIMGNDITLGIGLHSSLFFDYAIILPKDTFRSIEHRFSITKSFDAFDQTPEPTQNFSPLSFNISHALPSLALTEPTLVFSLQSSIDQKGDSLYFWCDTLPTDSRCNANPIRPNTTYEKPFPITLFLKTESNQNCLITIDTDINNTLMVSGYLPKGFVPIIDGNKINLHQDGQFESTISLQKENLDLSIQIIKK